MGRIPPDPLTILTFEERNSWLERDEEEYYNWVRRIQKVDSELLVNNKKVPRHRYNKNPLIP